MPVLRAADRRSIFSCTEHRAFSAAATDISRDGWWMPAYKVARPGGARVRWANRIGKHCYENVASEPA